MGQAQNGDYHEEDSPSTDPEMPPLIPVSSNPAEPPAVPPKTARQLLASQFEALARGRGRGRGRGKKAKSKAAKAAKSESSRAASEKPTDLSCLASIGSAPIFVGPGAAAPGASPKTVDFSRRAGDLAAMLDQLPAPSLEAVDSSQIPQRMRWTDRAREEIEVSAAATAKAAASQQDELLNPADLMNADASDSEGDVDEDEDDEDEENTAKKSARSCRPALRDLARELPPGAPQAESATEEVLQAVAAAGEGVSPQPGGSSYGPRFKNLSKSELTVARQKWQLHSLAGVEATSSEQNRRAAEELFAALKARRPAAEAAAEPEPVPAKPVFRKRVAPEAKPAEASARPEAFTTPGVRILEECIAGRGARRKAETLPESARPVAKRRKGVVIAGEDGEDAD